MKKGMNVVSSDADGPRRPEPAEAPAAAVTLEQVEAKMVAATGVAPPVAERRVSTSEARRQAAQAIAAMERSIVDAEAELHQRARHCQTHRKDARDKALDRARKAMKKYEDMQAEQRAANDTH
eukprot:4229797-Prymnesium_polylepis.1